MQNSTLSSSLSATARQFSAEKNSLQGKVILITGASDGIGKQLALSTAELGASVILLSRSQDKLEALYDEIVAKGYPTPAAAPIDLLEAGDNEYNELANLIAAEFGHLDALIHCAGALGKITPLEQTPTELFEQVLKINTSAEFALSKAMMPLLRKSEAASLVFSSSSVGRVGRAYWGAYAISKFAVEGMMQIWAQELENISQVRVNAINPGATRTRMRAMAYPAEDASQLKTPADIMPSYLYLLSAASLEVNGISLDAQEPRG